MFESLDIKELEIRLREIELRLGISYSKEELRDIQKKAYHEIKDFDPLASIAEVVQEIKKENKQ